MAQRCCLFDSSIGPCAVAWSDAGITAVQLPEADADATLAKIIARTGATVDTPDTVVRAAIDAMQRLVAGEKLSLGDIKVDYQTTTDFRRKVYEAARESGPGTTLTYGELAAKVGSRGASRAVGLAMAKNPVPIVVPCHRVLGASGRATGFSAHGGVYAKASMLAVEGAAGALRDVGPAPVAIGSERFDEAAVRAFLTAKDKRLGPWIAEVGPVTLTPDAAASPYESLARAIVFQQLHGAAARTIFGRLVALGPTGVLPTPEELLALDEAKLRGAGLSASKTAALRDLALKCTEGVVPDGETLATMSDQAIVDRLTRVRGIGRWTVEMMLIFRMGRPDVLPLADFGVKKGFQHAFKRREMPTAEVLEKHAARWRPWRSVASWYLWRVADRLKK